MWAGDAAEYTTAKIAVWWDMKDCPIPDDYDAGRIRPSIEGAFKELGYHGPVSITAYDDQTQTPAQILRGLSSTGVAVAHTRTECKCSLMYKDMVEWRDLNPPPAVMLIISDQVESVFAWDLARLQQRKRYNIFKAYSLESCFGAVLHTGEEWLWKTLLNKFEISSSLVEEKTGELSAKFYCKSCNFNCQFLGNFRKHLSSRKHAMEEVINPMYEELTFVTKEWGRDYQATPEHATAKIQVWWDMFDCPIPDGYDARRVRPSMEAAFKKLGYSGPVSITAYGDQKHTPDHILQGLSSTGIDVAQTVCDVTYKRLFSDLLAWTRRNPPPATMMVISDHVDSVLVGGIVWIQQCCGYNLFRAYSYRPFEMSVLVTSAEWLWDSLLGVWETRRLVLSESERSEESTGMFYCKLCFVDFKSLDDFRNHLSIKEHAQQEASIARSIKYSKYAREQLMKRENFPERKRKGYPMRKFPVRKRLRKGYHVGFRFLHKQLPS